MRLLTYLYNKVLQFILLSPEERQMIKERHKKTFYKTSLELSEQYALYRARKSYGLRGI
jgi:hypothetical protein